MEESSVNEVPGNIKFGDGQFTVLSEQHQQAQVAQLQAVTTLWSLILSIKMIQNIYKRNIYIS